MLNTMLFITLPYVAFFSVIVISIMRRRSGAFTYSSLSSQFLEGRQLFWGSNLWHYGLIVVLGGHLIGFCVPKTVIAFNVVPARLLTIEVIGLTGALMMGVGLVALAIRRLRNPRIRVVTSRMDIVLLVLLFLQVITGIYVVVTMRWGSTWYAAGLVPYLRSLFLLAPDISNVSQLPWIAKIHVVNAFVLIGILPFTRLVHLFSIPFAYSIRPNQVVRWNWTRTRT